MTLPAKPAAIVTGISNWEQAFDNLKGVFARIEDELERAGIAPTGKPLTVFVHTDDQGFRYEAMIPIAAVPEGKTELTPEIKFGRTPEGKAFRFVHKDAYEEIDGTYETITAYLDAKDIVARDAFIEEYVSEMKDATDADLEVNIYVQPKELGARHTSPGRSARNRSGGMPADSIAAARSATGSSMPSSVSRNVPQ